MTLAHLRRDDGFMLVSAVLLLMIMMSIGLAVVAFSDTQQNGARVERVREASFQLTEASMQGQIFQLGRAWPGTPAGAYPVVCTPTSAVTDPCPNASNLQATYTGPEYRTGPCPDGSPGDYVPWTTSVRDNGDPNRAGVDVRYYDENLAITRATYDANRDGKLWVRATGYARCKRQSAVALVTQNLRPLPFPRNVITANWFRSNNKGNKVIVDTRGPYASEPADLSLRCEGLTYGATTPNACAGYESTKGQVSPERLIYDTATSPAVDPAQLPGFRQQAQAAGHYYGPGVSCPDLRGIEGGVVFIEETSAGCSMPGGFKESAPGFLVINRGAVTFGGNSAFYGIIYAVNAGDLNTPVVSTSGTALIQGAVTVDGRGGVVAGASKANIVFDDRALLHVKGYAGAGIVQNSWRLLPDSK